MSAIKEWIGPLPDKSLPALKIRQELLKILQEVSHRKAFRASRVNVEQISLTILHRNIGYLRQFCVRCASLFVFVYMHRIIGGLSPQLIFVS